MASISSRSLSEIGSDVDVKIKRLNQYTGALIASLGGFALGVNLGWNSRASDILKNILHANVSEIGMVGAVLNAGAILGILLVPFVVRFISRLAMMFIMMPIFLIGWALICFADQKISLFVTGRIICGACSGTFCVLTPIYVGEIADKETRQRLLMFFQLLINCGIMYAFTVAHLIEERSGIWRYSLTCTITCITIALVNVLHESPLYHLTKHDEISAKGSLRWFRGNRYRITPELEEFKRLATPHHSGTKTMTIIKNRRVLRSFLTCLVVIVCYQLSGVNLITFYALAVFEIGGSGELTGSQQTLVVGAVQILSCLLATVLIDILGRRILLTVSSTLMGLFLALLAWFFSLRDKDPEYDDIYWWMPPTWITLFLAAFNFGIGPISWALLGDVFPSEIRLSAATSMASLSWLLSLIKMTFFGEILGSLGITKMMWLFATFCWVCAIFCALIVKENGGKSLLEIQQEFDIDYSNPEVRNTAPQT